MCQLSPRRSLATVVNRCNDIRVQMLLKQPAVITVCERNTGGIHIGRWGNVDKHAYSEQLEGHKPTTPYGLAEFEC